MGNRKFDVYMDETFINKIDEDDWGCAELIDKEKGIGCEYNYCIQTETNGELNNCSAIYLITCDKDDNVWETDYQSCKRYEIEWRYDWKEKLEKAMNDFLDEQEKELEL